ncbi:unnamed protein product [marine sediment metagenome]|uniref:Uncharacterized protein n=1 Tax=marine sediment metagenome TaxID=412755 RepID=X1HUN5_9ZZZZ
MHNDRALDCGIRVHTSGKNVFVALNRCYEPRYGWNNRPENNGQGEAGYHRRCSSPKVGTEIQARAGQEHYQPRDNHREVNERDWMNISDQDKEQHVAGQQKPYNKAPPKYP